MLPLKLIVLLLAAAAQGRSGTNKVFPVPVTVLKCCRIGETLPGGDAAGESGCEAGASTLWAPLIYAPKRKTMLQQGIIPSYFTVAEAQYPVCGPSEDPALIRSSGTQKNFLLFSNGSLWLHESKTMLAPTTFCVESAAAVACLRRQPLASESGEMSHLVRPGGRIRVKKCCGKGAAYSEKTGACVAVSGGEELQAADVRLAESETENGTLGVLLTEGFPVCRKPDSGLVIAGSLAGAAVSADGAVQVSDAGVSLPREQFCLERVVEEAEAARVFACADSVDGGAQRAADGADIRFKLYPAGLLVSTAFLAATLAAGFLLPSSHHALHWRCQTHYIACLLIGDLILAITQLASNSISGTACVTMAIMMHFFFLAAFFWLNTMCFNIWWTFRDFRPTSLEKRQEGCRLRVYEVFAWGGPLLIAGVAAALDRLPPDPLRPFLRPRFGVRNCWFYGDMEILTFFFGPIGVLLGVNLLLFASTTRQLTCGLWKREDVKSTTERAALGRVCMKLVVVMGVTWVADVISWAVGGPNYVWYITDLINALQGVLIFIVVGCQPQVWAALKKMWCLKKLRSNVTNVTGAPMHSSSQGLPSMGDSVTNNTIANTNTSVKIPMETVC